MVKRLSYALLFTLLMSCNDDKKPIEPIIEKQHKDTSTTITDTLSGKKTIESNFPNDFTKESKQSQTEESPEKLAQLATILSDTVPDTGPYLKLCKVPKSESINWRKTTDSLSLSRVKDSTINLNDTTVTYVGFTIDFDSDDDSDLVVLKMHNIDSEPTSNIIDISFFCRNGRRFTFNSRTTISDVIDPCEIYRSVEITSANDDEYPDFCINSSTGGSGGGNSCYFMIWNGKKMQQTSYVSTGKWAWAEDVNEDGIDEVVLVNYVSQNGPYRYYNDKYGVKVFQLDGYSLVDASDDFSAYEKRLRNNL